MGETTHQVGETTHQIAAHIEHTRDHLGSNLHELEARVKSATDWKQHFESKPMTMVAAAFGGGVVLATMLGGRKPSRTASSHVSPPHGGTDHQLHKALETWDTIKGALIGLAATRFKDFIGEMVPGFKEQFREIEENAKGRARPTIS